MPFSVWPLTVRLFRRASLMASANSKEPWLVLKKLLLDLCDWLKTSESGAYKENNCLHQNPSKFEILVIELVAH